MSNGDNSNSGDDSRHDFKFPPIEVPEGWEPDPDDEENCGYWEEEPCERPECETIDCDLVSPEDGYYVLVCSCKCGLTHVDEVEWGDGGSW